MSGFLPFAVLDQTAAGVDICAGGALVVDGPGFCVPTDS
jgi:hypothetical protein